MSGFHITCTTCKSRLKVKDESAVGLILSCPKCGSMVMVQAPEASAETVEGAVEATAAAPQRHHSSAETRVDGFSLGDVDELLDGRDAPQAPPSRDGDVRMSPGDATASVATEDAASIHVTEAVDGELRTSGGEAADGAVAMESSEALLPGNQWMSRESRQLRQWMLAGGAMVFGVGATIALIVFLLGNEKQVTSTDSPRNLPKQSGVLNEVAEQDDNARAAANDPTTSNPETPGGPPSAPDADPAEASDPQLPPVPAATGDGAPSPAQGSLPPIPGAEPLELPENPENPENEAPKVSDPSQPSDPGDATGPPTAPTATADPPESGADPLQLPGSPLQLPGSPLDPLSPLPGVGEGIGDLLNDEAFSAFESIIEDAADLAPPLPVDPDEESLYNRFNAEINPPRRPPGMRIDAVKQLALELPQIAANDVPLDRFSMMFMDATNVPITLDPHAVIYGHVLPDAGVNCRLDSASVQLILETAVAPLGLQLHVGERHARLQLKDRNALIEYDFAAGDLATDEADRRWLASAVQHMVRPGQWAPNTPAVARWEGDKLHIKQSRLGMHETLELLETLRVARELPSQVAAPQGRYAIGPRRNRALEKLNRNTNVNFRDPMPLLKVLQRLTEQTELTFLVDWHAIEVEGWNLKSEATLLTHNESLGKALRLLLTPMKLDYLVLSGDVAIITTPAEATAWRELAVYKVPDLVPEGNDVEQALQEVREALGSDNFQPGTGNRLAFDVSSRTLLARLSQADQRRLQTLINQLRIRD